MSATETPETDPPDPDEQPDDDPDGEPADEPELSDDDLVDVDDEMAAAVAGDDGDDDAESADSSDGDADTSTSSASPTETLTSGTSAGDIYCNALGMGATVARQSKGSGIEDREAAMEDYGDLARQLDLDAFVNEWVREHGAADELTPGQGVAIGTAMFAMAVMVEDPAIVENLGSEEGEST